MTKLYLNLRGYSGHSVKAFRPRKVSKVWTHTWRTKKESPLSFSNWAKPFPNQSYNKLHSIDYHVHNGGKVEKRYERFDRRQTDKLKRHDRGWTTVKHWL